MSIRLLVPNANRVKAKHSTARGCRIYSASFNPASIAGLSVWLDASKISGLSNGASINTWNDASGNSNNATQTGTASPTYATNITSNGKAAVLFTSASSQYFNLTSTLSSQILTVFVVAKANTNATMTMVCGNTGSMEYRITNTTSYQTVNKSQTAAIGNGTIAPGTTNFNSMNMSFSTPNLTLRMNGAADNTASVPTTFSDPIRYIGINGAGGTPTSYFNGYMAEVLIYSSLLDLATKQQVEAYLKSKWGTP